MKTYYDILEISRYASKEVLERAHRTLIKKYHPDLETDPVKKREKEEYIKRINEAYEILSDENKKKAYDYKVFGSDSSANTAKTVNDDVVDQKQADNLEQKRANDEYNKIVDDEIKKAQERINDQEKAIKENLKKYERAYLRSLGYHAPEPIQWKRVGITIIAVIILLVLMWIIYLIPPFRMKINVTIEEKTAVGMFLHIIKSIYIAFGSIISSLFKK